METRAARYQIPNLAQACRVLELLGQSTRGMNLRTITQRLELPHTTGLRIVATLLEARFLERQGDLYQLGPALLALGRQVSEARELPAILEPILQQLALATQETAHAAILSDGQVLLIQVVQSPAPLRAGAPVGTRADLHASATGKVLLAFMSPERQAASLAGITWTQRTERTHRHAQSLGEELVQIAQRRWAIDDEEYFPGVRCLAVPISNAQGQVIAALGITGAASRVLKSRLPELLRPLQAAGEEASKRLGFRGAIFNKDLL